MRAGWVVMNRNTGALLGCPRSGRLTAVGFWTSEAKAKSALLKLCREGKLKSTPFEWEVLPLIKFA